MVKDYSKGKIYMIVCNVTGKQYVGSTTKQYLSQRLDTHRGYFKAWLSNNVKYNYVTSFVILENNDYHIKLLQLYPCSCNDELRMKEREYQDANECVNQVRAYISEEEKKDYEKEYRETHNDKIKLYYEENKEVILEKTKVYQKNNKEKIIEKCKVYYEENKEELNKKCKVYYEENKKELKKKCKVYYEENKEEIKKKANEKFNCICGGRYTHIHKARHHRSKKHMDFVNTQPTQ